MAVSVLATSLTVQSSNATSITATEPSGASEGELLVALHCVDSSPTLGLPSGWAGSTQMTAGGTSRIAWIVRGSSAPDLTFTSTASEHHVVIMLRVSGFDPLNPLSSIDPVFTFGAIPNTGAYGSQTDGGLVISAFGADTDLEPDGVPSGYTSAGYGHSATGSGTCTAGMAYKSLTLADLDDAGDWGTSAIGTHATYAFCIHADPDPPSNANSPVAESWTSAETTGGTDITIDKPAGVVSGDVLLFAHSTDNAETITPPTGFTVITDDTNSGHCTMQVSWKEATGSEPATYTSSSGSSEHRVAFMVRLSNADVAALVNASAANDTGVSFPSSPTITTTEDDALVFRLYAGGNNDGAYAGFPSGSAGIRNMVSQYSSGSGRCCGGIAVELKEAAGVVPAVDWGTTAVSNVAATIAIKGLSVGGAVVSLDPLMLCGML